MRGSARRGDSRRTFADPCPAARPAFEPTAFAQGVIGSDHGGAADRERLRERPFRWQPDSRMDRAPADGVDEPASQLLLQRAWTGGPDSEVRYERADIDRSPLLM